MLTPVLALQMDICNALPGSCSSPFPYPDIISILTKSLALLLEETLAYIWKQVEKMTSIWLDREKPFHSDEFHPRSTYDTVVVGAGLTGLVTAVLLARGGKNVLVL